MSSQPTRSVPPARGRSRPAYWIAGTVLILTLGLIAWSAWPVLRPVRTVTVTQAIFDRSSVTSDASLVEASTSTTRSAKPTVQAAGWLEAEPFYVAATALADGILEEMLVLEGDAVAQGQVIARLVSEDSELRVARAQASLAQAESARAIAEAELVAAREAWASPIELERAVVSGRAMVNESEAELARLPLLIESAHATLVRLREERDRTAASREAQGSSELEVIIAEQVAAAQDAEVRALEARRGVLEARIAMLRSELHAAERDLELRIEDTRRLATAQANVSRGKADEDLAKAVLAEAELELERMTIRAPITGYVQRRLKLPGDKVIRGMDSPVSAHIAHLYDPAKLQVRVDVPLADASHVDVGQRCEIIVEVLPDRTFDGEVVRTTHEADLQKNTLQFKVRVLNPDAVLRPEMLTRVKFLPGKNTRSPQASAGTGGTTRSRVYVPESTIAETPSGPAVWIVTDRANGRGIVSSMPIDALSSEDGWALVEGRLTPGTLIVTNTEGLREGERVAITVSEGAGV